MVSHNKRIVAALAAVAAMGIGLAGCGGSDTAGDTKSGSDGGVVNITYMHRLPDSEGMTLVNDIVAKWNKEHPNIQVKATKFDGNAADMIKKLETDVKAGNPPDLAQVGYAEVPEVFTKGLMQDVTDEAGPLTYFYNAAEFEKLGITVPKTADELIETAKKTAAQGKYIMTFQPDEAMMMMSGQAGASGPWYKVDGNSWVVNTQTKGSKAVADVYQQLIDNKAALTNPRWDASFDNSNQSGQLLGTVAAAWEAPLFIDSAGGTGAGEWKVTQLGDWFGNGTKTGSDGGSGVAVLKGSKHPAEAMEFLDWFNTQVDDLVSQGLVVAATTADAKTPQKWSDYFSGQDVMAEFKTANDNMGDFTYMPGFSAVGAAMKQTAAKAADGSAKVSDVFDTAQKTSVDTLKNLGLSVKE